MKVTLNLDEKLLEPLLKNHLVEEISVQRQIEEALKFYNLCMLQIEKGKCIAYGDPKNGYFNNWQLIKEGKILE